MAAAYALWLASLPLVSYIRGYNPIELQLLVWCGIIPVALQYGLNLVDRKLSGRALIIGGLVAELFVVNYMANTENVGAVINLAYPFNVLFIMAIGICISRAPDKTFVIEIAKALVIVSLPLLMLMWWKVGHFSLTFDKIVIGRQKNLSAFPFFTIGTAALMLRPSIGKITIIGFCAGMIAIFNSRNQFFALTAAILFYWGFMRLRNWRRLTSSLLLVAIISFLAVLAVYDPYYRAFQGLVRGTPLDWEGVYHTLTTGLSGRVELWRVHLQIWLEEPLLGIGFRRTEADPRFVSAGAGYAHNGYLGILVELGLVGFTLYIAILFTVFRNILKASIARAPKAALLAYLVGYCVYNIAEGRPMNTGNPFSIMMMIIWMCSFTFPRQSRAVAPARRRSAITSC